MRFCNKSVRFPLLFIYVTSETKSHWCTNSILLEILRVCIAETLEALKRKKLKNAISLTKDIKQVILGGRAAIDLSR